MSEELDLWRLAAGLGRFLLGMRHRIYDEVSRGELSEVEISTLLNVNRELLVANQSLVSALADALLNMDSARDFASIPAAGQEPVGDNPNSSP